jgi:hypothetical protein
VEERRRGRFAAEAGLVGCSIEDASGNPAKRLGAGSSLTLRWSGMDSNFQYAGAVNLIVAHLVLGLLLWVSQGVPILRTTLCWREMESNYWFPVAKKMNPVREPEPKPSRR